jgi:hypothetical protein
MRGNKLSVDKTKKEAKRNVRFAKGGRKKFAFNPSRPAKAGITSAR